MFRKLFYIAIFIPLLTLAACGSDDPTPEIEGASQSNTTSNETPPTPPTTQTAPTPTESTAATSIINAQNADQLVEYTTIGNGTLMSFEWLPDSQHLLVNTSVGIRIYDVESPDTVQQFFPQYDGVVAVSPDGSRAISRPQVGTLVLWSIETGEDIATLEIESDSVFQAEFSPDGQTIHVVDGQNILQFESDSGESAESITLPVDTIYQIAYQHDQILIAVVGVDSTLAVWDVAANEMRFEIGEEITTRFSIMEFNTDGSILITPNVVETDFGGYTGYTIPDVDLWDTVTGENLRTLPYSQSRFHIAPDGSSYAFIDYNGKITIRDILTDDDILSLGDPSSFNPNNYMSRPLVSPDGQWVAARNSGGRVMLFSKDNPTVISAIDDFDTLIVGVGLSSDNQYLCIGFQGGNIQTWDIESDEMTDSVEGSGNYLFVLADHPTDDTFFAASSDITRHPISDLETTVTNLMSVQANHMLVSPDGNLLVVEYNDTSFRANGSRPGNKILIWNLQTDSRHISDIDTPSVMQVRDLDMSSDGKWLAITYYGQVVHIIDVDTGILSHELTFDQWATHVAFDPSSTTIAVIISPIFAPDDEEPDTTGELQLWDASTGELIQTLFTNEDGLQSVTYSPDGSLIAVGKAQNGGISLLDAESGEAITVLGAGDLSTSDLFFSPDGALLVSVGTDNIVRVWTLPIS